MNNKLHGGEVCRSCGAPVVWLKTRKGKDMICEAKVTVIYTAEGDQVRGHEPHWSSCPDAMEWRSDRRRPEVKPPKRRV